MHAIPRVPSKSLVSNHRAATSQDWHLPQRLVQTYLHVFDFFHGFLDQVAQQQVSLFNLLLWGCCLLGRLTCPAILSLLGRPKCPAILCLTGRFRHLIISGLTVLLPRLLHGTSIGFLHAPEKCLRGEILVRRLVWMKFQGQLTIGLLDLRLRGPWCQAKGDEGQG